MPAIRFIRGNKRWLIPAVVLTVSPSVSQLVLGQKNKLLLIRVKLNIKTLMARALSVFFRLTMASIVSRLSIFCLSGVICQSLVWADCPVARVDEVVRLTSIYDGDTLRLEDGRRIRVLGINAPEMARKGQPAEPLSAEAKKAAKVFLAHSEVIQLSYERQKKDRYGRMLAHVYDEKGRSLAAHLLSSGLAFHISIPPNVAESDCLHQQEISARRLRKGIWRHSYWLPRAAPGLTLDDKGFRRISGKVVKITEGRTTWIELDGPVVLKIAATDKSRFKQHPWRHWQGKRLEVIGWVVDRSDSAAVKSGFKPLVVQVRTPYAIKVD